MNFSEIKRRLRKFVLGFDIQEYYFSQTGEDAILRYIFERKLSRREKGFYVDIGAFDPYKYSNTYLFYRNGWRGINIDPSPGVIDLFIKARPRDVNLPIAIGPQKEVRTLYLVKDRPGMNTFNRENLVRLGLDKYIEKEVAVHTLPLAEVLDTYAHAFQHIDFFTIDVEGFEFEVLNSNDWKKYRPSAICVELNCTYVEDLKNNRTAQYLTSLGYSAVAKTFMIRDVSSVIFVANEYGF
ncbi:MAG: FkbM family methyltransferase [Bacteroidia bacterium]